MVGRRGLRPFKLLEETTFRHQHSLDEDLKKVSRPPHTAAAGDYPRAINARKFGHFSAAAGNRPPNQPPRAAELLTLDHVKFSLLSRSTVKPGEAVALDVLIHKPDQRESVLEHINKIHQIQARSKEYSLRTEEPVSLLQGTALTVKVSFKDVSVALFEDDHMDG